MDTSAGLLRPEGRARSRTYRAGDALYSRVATALGLRVETSGDAGRAIIIGELGSGMNVNRNHPNIGPRLSFVDKRGGLIARLGGADGPGLEAGKFIAPHGLAVDSRGDIYVGEVSYTEYPRLFPENKIPWRMRSLQKLEKVN